MTREVKTGRAKGVAALALLSLACLILLPGAGGAAVFDQIHPGHYHGGGFPSTPVDFGVSADRHKVKNFTTRIKMDCKQGGRLVGFLTLKRVIFRPIRIQKTFFGGRFQSVGHARFNGGGGFRVVVRGVLLAPDRARGKLRARGWFPGDVTCKPPFGPIGWTARFRG